jgi:hypothetical protein
MKPQDHTEEVPESEMIRAEIEQTRESMDQTLDELGEKIKPRHILDEFLGVLHLRPADIKQRANAVAHSAGNAAHAVGDAFSRHRMPALLIGSGIAWALYEWRRSNQAPTRRYAPEPPEHYVEDLSPSMASTMETSEEPTHTMKEKVKEKAAAAGQQLREKSRQLRDAATGQAKAIGEKAVHLKDQIQYQAKHGYEVSREKFVESTRAHPLSVGLGFLAIGVLAGLAVPLTRREDDCMGQAADRVKARVKAKGQELMERGKHVASAVAGAARQSAEKEGLMRSGTTAEGSPQGEPAFRPAGSQPSAAPLSQY